MLDLVGPAIEAGPKAAQYACLLLAIGVQATRWLLVPRLASGVPTTDQRAIEQALIRLSRNAALLMLLALGLRAWAHTMVAFGWRDSFRGDQFSLIILESRWGGGWRIQVAAAALFLAATFVVSIHRRAGWALTASAVVACAVSVPLLGHAAGQPLSVLLHAAHMVGTGLWLGTLACILLIRRAPAIQLLRHLSPIALTGATIGAAAGAIAAVQYVGSPANLWATVYGRALLLKLGLFLGILVCGYINWRRWSAVRAGMDEAGAKSARPATLEELLAAAIVLVTSVLTEIAHP